MEIKHGQRGTKMLVKSKQRKWEFYGASRDGTD